MIQATAGRPQITVDKTRVLEQHLTEQLVQVAVLEATSSYLMDELAAARALYADAVDQLNAATQEVERWKSAAEKSGAPKTPSKPRSRSRAAAKPS